MKKHKQAWVAWSREVTGTRRAHGCGWARLQQLRACRVPRDTPTLLAWLIGFLSRNVNNLMVQVAHQLLHTRYTDHSLDTQPTAHNLAEGGGGVSASWRHPCCHASSYARPDVRGTRKGCCSGSAPAGAAPGLAWLPSITAWGRHLAELAALPVPPVTEACAHCRPARSLVWV